PQSVARASKNFQRRFRSRTGRSNTRVQTSSLPHMFTGIIEETGEVAEISDAGDFRTIRIRGKSVFDDLRLGSSIAVNGVCLTVRSIAPNSFTAELSRETLDRTTLRRLAVGSVVN